MRLWQFHIRRTNTVLLDVNRMWKNIQFKNINRCPSVTNKWLKQAIALLPLAKATFNLCTLSQDIRDRYLRNVLEDTFKKIWILDINVIHIDLSKWERVKFSWTVRGSDSHCRFLGSIPAFSDTEESEGWQMKQFWIKYRTDKTFNPLVPNSLFFDQIRWNLERALLKV